MVRRGAKGKVASHAERDIITAIAHRMPRPVDWDEGGRMEIEIYFMGSKDRRPVGGVLDYYKRIK